MFCDGRVACCALLNELVERADTAIAVLKQHHDWHQEIGTILFPAEAQQDGPTEIDLSVEYADSTLCNRTMDAINGKQT